MKYTPQAHMLKALSSSGGTILGGDEVFGG
jgi:hypothetical protein